MAAHLIAQLRTAWKAIQRARKALSRADRVADKVRDRMLLKDIERAAKVLLLCLVLPLAGCRTASVRFLESDGISVPWHRKAAYNVCDGVSRLETWVGQERKED